METSHLIRDPHSVLDKADSIIAAVNRLSILAQKWIGQSSKAYSQNSYNKLLSLSDEKVNAILERIKKTEKILNSTVPVEPSVPQVHDEWPVIQRALKEFDLRLDDDFSAYLQKDDVIELYGSDHIQLFRTFNFYKYSAYSQLDLLVNEWFHLWKRSNSLLQSLYAVGQAVVNGEKRGVISMDEIPQHVYREIYNSEAVKDFEVRSVLCKFGHICPVYTADDKIGGFLINCRVKVLAMGEDTKNLAFI